MGKNKKKRNKVYSGSDSTTKRPIVTRISAVNRTTIGQWWHENKKVAKPILITIAIGAAIIILVIEIIRIFVGN